MIDQPTIDKILEAANILEVVSQFVTLRKRGTSYVGLCPFHADKSPSFYVSPAKNICKCFACGEGGTAVHFIMKHEQLTYFDALRWLAKKYHIEIQERELTPRERQMRNDRESMLILNTWAQKYFTSTLLETEEGRSIGMRYFAERGLREDIVRKFQLGYSLDQRDALFKAALRAGYKREYLERTGLVIPREQGQMLDRFRGRVIYPIHTLSGKVVAFGGRTLKKGEKTAKYVNSPESEVYHKSSELYGLYFAKQEIVKQDRCYLVEGYMDVIGMHQVGVENVVASSGTALTQGQIRLIHRFTNNITVLYDGDSAGIKAALRGIDMLLEEGMNVKVVLLPDGEDPDSFACSHTLEQVRDYISAHEQDFIGFMTAMLLGEAGNDPLKKASLVNEVADTIALIPDQIIRAMYIQTCAQKFGIEEKILYDRVRKSREAMLEAEKKQRDREREREERTERVHAEAVGLKDEEDGPSESAETKIPAREVPAHGDEEPLTASAERELLKFLLEYGDEKLIFDKDSRFYVSGEESSVAEFILDTLDGNALKFRNSRYSLLLDEYTRLFDSGLPQASILARLRDSSDPELTATARDLLVDKYNLTVLNFEHSLTTTSTMLVMYVPKALLKLQLMNMEIELKSLQKELMGKLDDADAQMKLMQSIAEKGKMKAALSRMIQQI